MEMTVMTYNLRTSTSKDGDNDWVYRSGQATRMIRDHEPVIVGTQEMRAHMLAELQLDEFAWVGEGRRGGSEDEHCAIFYKKAVVAMLEHGTFWLSERPETPSMGWDTSLPRVCTWAHMRYLVDDTEFVVFNTHLDHKGALAKEMGIKLIWSRIQEMRERKHLPIILMGDFNSTPGEIVVRIMRGEAPVMDGFVDMRDTYAVIDGPVGTSANPNFSGNTEGETIDYIFVTPDITVLSAEIDRRRIDGKFPSDHYPVVARLRLSPDIIK
ncbi:endonuclease/exonuclease/phosphatase family protein [Paenibacillus sp. MWE-103]|uniref:Endonuclease/exonuclease/phosphatase family protein n=1 Tax=Paenibacillus artemisiicola TaxID=1172618 RepID=A0ABS3WFA7_9BACL|nr:endonuclease/exonuclease/phosphatase family protein [Paenibacillus artemisiicola]MBO7746994.1 endonuclease/exonuclease/phosphatase family protein [Paenibacillus artemisiicola]